MRSSGVLITHLLLFSLTLPIPAHSTPVLHGDTATDCLEALTRLSHEARHLDSYHLVLIGSPPYRYLTVLPNAGLVTDDPSTNASLHGRELGVRTPFGEVRTTLRAPAVILGLVNLEDTDVDPSYVTVLWNDRVAFLTTYSVVFARLESDGRIELERQAWFDKYRDVLPVYRPRADYCEYRFDTRDGTVEVKFYDLWGRTLVTVRANLGDENATFDETTADPETLEEIESKLAHLPERLREYWSFLLVRTPEGVEPVAITIDPLELAPDSHLAEFLRTLNLADRLQLSSPLSLAPALLALTARLYAAVGLSVEIRWGRDDVFERLYDEVWSALPVAACWNLLYPLVSNAILKSIVERLRSFGLPAIVPCCVSVAVWEWVTENAVFPVLERWYWGYTVSMGMAPVVEEPFKRLVAVEFGIPRIVSGAVYGLLEGLWHWVSGIETGPLLSILLDKAATHALLTVLPLPLAMELHSRTFGIIGGTTAFQDSIHLLNGIITGVLTGDVPTILDLLYYTALSVILENTFGIPVTPGL